MGGDHAEVRMSHHAKEVESTVEIHHVALTEVWITCLQPCCSSTLVSRAAIMDALRLQTLPNPS